MQCFSSPSRVHARPPGPCAPRQHVLALDPLPAHVGLSPSQLLVDLLGMFLGRPPAPLLCVASRHGERVWRAWRAWVGGVRASWRRRGSSRAAAAGLVTRAAAVRMETIHSRGKRGSIFFMHQDCFPPFFLAESTSSHSPHTLIIMVGTCASCNGWCGAAAPKRLRQRPAPHNYIGARIPLVLLLLLHWVLACYTRT